jgi:hypothetical protein
MADRKAAARRAALTRKHRAAGIKGGANETIETSRTESRSDQKTERSCPQDYDS